MTFSIISQPSPNHGPRNPGTIIDMLVIHYTGMPTPRDAVDRLLSPQSEVSCHYLVHEDGTVIQMVAEERRAWHAGISFWRGQGDVNNRSIGIEIVNPGHEFGYRPFTAEQMDAVIPLCQKILQRHPGIVARNVVGHADVAPWRKEDPGELFDWPRLAAAGIGIVPPEEQETTLPLPPEQVGEALSTLGYHIHHPSSAEPALIAFQRHYCPSELAKGATELTCRRLASLLQAVAACCSSEQ